MVQITHISWIKKGQEDVHFVCGLAHTGADVQIKSTLLTMYWGKLAASQRFMGTAVICCFPDVRSAVLYKRSEIHTNRDGPHFLASGVVIGVRKQTVDNWTLGCAPLLQRALTLDQNRPSRLATLRRSGCKHLWKNTAVLTSQSTRNTRLISSGCNAMALTQCISPYVYIYMFFI